VEPDEKRRMTGMSPSRSLRQNAASVDLGGLRAFAAGASLIGA